MSTVKCFLIEPTGYCARWLRRWAFGRCPLDESEHSYHQVIVPAEQAAVAHDQHGISSCEQFAEDDPRWPEACPCGFAFGKYRVKQTFFAELYRLPDGSEVTVHHSVLPGVEKAPAGAMWFADWFSTVWRGPDGHCLVVMLPDGGEWMIDGPSKDGKRWARDGIPPFVNVSPSIATGTYHGQLRNGELIEC
jgi:hypothetical protein